MTWLKQSTAVTVPIGPIVDSTDGATAETAFTISQADIRLSKNGGAFAQTNNATGASHMENGWYGVPLDTTDTATLGELVVNIAESGGLQVWARFQVVSAAAYDFFCGSTALAVNVTQISGDSVAADNAESFFDGTGYAGTNNVIPTVTTTGTATNVTTVNGLAANVITATSIATDAITAAKIATDAIGASELAADAATEIGTAVWATAVRTLTADTNINYPAAATIATAVLTTALTEAYAADGVAPTLSQLLFLVQQRLTEMAQVGTTLTVNKLDGTTAAATFTLDSATAPTSITRAT